MTSHYQHPPYPPYPPPSMMPGSRCVCGAPEPSRCRCGAAASMQMSQMSGPMPYPPVPEGPPYGYDQMASTSMYPMTPDMSTPPMQPQLHPAHLPPHQLPGGPQYSRSPSRVHQWMNNHHPMNMPYANSPAPSITPSVMSMSHMSINDDMMSVNSMSMMGTEYQPQYTDMRPSSQISTSSYAENIDPRLPSAPPPQAPPTRQPTDPFQKLKEILAGYNDPKNQHNVIKMTTKWAKDWKKTLDPRERRKQPSEQRAAMLVRLLENAVAMADRMIGKWKDSPGGETVRRDEDAFNLWLTIFILVKHQSQRTVLEWMEEKKYNLLTSLTQYLTLENGAPLLTLCEMLEWRSTEGVKFRAEAASRPEVLSHLMQMLSKEPSGDMKQLFRDAQFRAFLLKMMKLLISGKHEVHGAARNQLLNNPSGGVVFCILSRTLPDCERCVCSDRMTPDYLPSFLDVVDRSFKCLSDFLKSSGDPRIQPLVDQATQHFLCNDGLRRVSWWFTERSNPTIVNEGTKLLALAVSNTTSRTQMGDILTNMNQQAVEEIFIAVRRGLKLCPNDPPVWDQALYFLSTFTASRNNHKMTFIKCSAFDILRHALIIFPLGQTGEVQIKPAVVRQHNEVVDNAALCMTSLLRFKNQSQAIINSPEYEEMKRNSFDVVLLKHLMNHLCRGEPSVQNRILKLLYNLLDVVSYYRSDDYLRQVLEESTSQNLMTLLLFHWVHSAPQTYTQMVAHAAKGGPTFVNMQKSFHAALISVFQLLNLITNRGGERSREDVTNYIRANPKVLMELLNLAQNSVPELAVEILKLCNAVLTYDLSLADLMGIDSVLIDTLAISSDGNIAHHAKLLASKTSSNHLHLAGVFDDMMGP